MFHYVKCFWAFIKQASHRKLLHLSHYPVFSQAFPLKQLMQIPYGEETTSSTEATGKFEQSPPSWPPRRGRTASHHFSLGEEKSSCELSQREAASQEDWTHFQHILKEERSLCLKAALQMISSTLKKRPHRAKFFFPPQETVSHQRETEVGCTRADNFGSKIWSILPTSQGKHVFYLFI